MSDIVFLSFHIFSGNLLPYGTSLLYYGSGVCSAPSIRAVPVGKNDGVGDIGIETAKETVVGCFWEEGLSLLSHFCSFSCMDAMNDSYSAMAVVCRRITSSERAVLSLVYINIPGEKDENNAGNQNQYSAPFSPGEIKEFFKGFCMMVYFRKPSSLIKISAIPIGAIYFRMNINSL